MVCNAAVSASQLFLVKQHLNTAKHKQAAEKKNRETVGASQSLLTQYQNRSNSSTKLNEFNMDITKWFLEANIPLHKISHPSTKFFMEKYMKFSAPSDSAIRQNYVPVLYEEILNKLRKLAATKYIWVSVDETTDVEQRYIINFIFGILGVDEEKDRSYLFSMAQLHKTDNHAIAKFFIDSLNLLWPEGK